MSYVHQLRTSGVSESGATEMLLGKPLSDPVDRTTVTAHSKLARNQVFQLKSASVTESTSAARLVNTGRVSMQQAVAAQRAAEEAKLVAAIQEELARIAAEIAYWMSELVRAKSRLKALIAKRTDSRKSGSATPASESAYAKAIKETEEDIAWIEDQLGTLEDQQRELQAKLNEIRARNVELSRSAGVEQGTIKQAAVSSAASKVGLATKYGHAVNAVTAGVLAELQRLAEEIESVKKQLERRLDELNGPAPSAPPPSASEATMLMYIEMMKMRQQNLREEIRRLQKKLAALQAEYVALLAKL